MISLHRAAASAISRALSASSEPSGASSWIRSAWPRMGGEQVVELVGDAAGHGADDLEPLLVGEGLLTAVELLQQIVEVL